MRHKLGWLVLWPTVAVSLLLLIVGVSAAWYVHRLNRDVSHGLVEQLTAVLAVERLVSDLRELRLDLDRFADTGDTRHWNAAVGARREIQRSLEEIHRSSPTSDRRILSHATKQAYERFVAQLETVSEQPDAARRASTADLKSLLTADVLMHAERLLDLQQAVASKSSVRNRAIATRVGLGLLLLGVCGAVAGLLTGYGVARALRRSMTQLSVPVRDMAGKLNEVVGPITISSEANLTELEVALCGLSERTTEVVRRLQRAQHQTLRVEQLAAVGQLAAGLAHELRNPLTSMKLLVQAAAVGGETSSLQSADLVVLQEEILRLESMLQTFLDFARPPRPLKQLVNLPELIEQTLRVVRLRAAQQQVEIHYDCSTQPPGIEGDGAQLHQMLLNLVFNALDALPGGGNIWVQVATANVPSKTGQLDERLTICVADDGSGLPVDEAERIFEPFVSTKDTGMGLGLSICKQIADAHGAELIAKNRTEGGAEFTVRLPPGGPTLAASTPESAEVPDRNRTTQAL